MNLCFIIFGSLKFFSWCSLSSSKGSIFLSLHIVQFYSWNITMIFWCPKRIPRCSEWNRTLSRCSKYAFLSWKWHSVVVRLLRKKSSIFVFCPLSAVNCFDSAIDILVDNIRERLPRCVESFWHGLQEDSCGNCSRTGVAHLNLSGTHTHTHSSRVLQWFLLNGIIAPAPTSIA